ncbi:MAG: DUF1553 domain-containing protein, partial [Saprospiraceae bacterium]|nr:DUF1553 domain-containing protein [Saprospiraceae bacterium]
NAREANLRLDLKESAFAPLDSSDSRVAIDPGNARGSELIKRISSTDPEYMMPPPVSNLDLSDFEVRILTKWIEQGAEWKPHWAFTVPIKVDLPKASAKWVQKSIDHFVVDRLQREGLKPAPEATREKLIRRLSFDLRGLPPSLEEIETYITDQSDDAYEKLVDRFLDDKGYGERMAMEWMDVSRYADSHGYQDDLERSMWPWRDWVIEAFNDNMPYDQFVTWQLAGDLFPEATYEQRLATGFNRNHKITQEVGVINEEYRVTYVLDRVNTFSNAFLGLTVECAQCHDHKFDPITQKEYYSLFGFFNNVPEKGRVEYGVEVAEPYLPLPEEKVTELRTYVRRLVENQQNTVEDYAKHALETKLNMEALSSSMEPSNNSLPPGLVGYYPLDFVEGQELREEVEGGAGVGKNDLILVPGKSSGGLEFMGTNYADLIPGRSFNFSKPFTISFWIKSLDGGIRGPILGGLSGKETNNFAIQVNNDKRFTFHMGSGTQNIQFHSKETLPENRWVHIAITHDGSLKMRGIRMYMDGALLDRYEYGDNVRTKIPTTQGLLLGAKSPIQLMGSQPEDEDQFFRGQTKGLVAGQLDEIMFYNRPLQASEIQLIVAFNPLPSLLAAKYRDEHSNKRLFYHQLLHMDVNFQKQSRRFREYKIREGRLNDIVLKPTMVMADMDTVRPTFVLDRGQYDAPTHRVQAGTPKAVLAFKDSYPKNRQGLSTWLFDPENPLTARVAVNRYWQMIFGKGIVATPADFGSQGSLPSHPDLLDWLAVEFRDSGWDLKKLLKLMITSATYRQSVESSEQLQRIDPNNVLLSRGPQARLSAEMIRDHALSISGLLSPQIGGPSVKPYQPDGLWLQVASGNQSLRKYIQDHDQDLYRRSLYTFWKRTIPPPSMTIFDAPSREQCVVERRATSTPMQALVLLNDPQFTESARMLATRMLQQGGESPEDRLIFAFRLATSRAPQQEELRSLLDLLDKETSLFEDNPATAEKLITVGEFPVPKNINPSSLAAYSVVAMTIFNLTETILKG